jgi:cyclopropane-fatty-acyl-phospholipid synthase
MREANDNYKLTVTGLLKETGIKIDGSNPWDIRIYNHRFYRKVLTEGDLGLGEAYMDKWWDAERVDEFIYKVIKARLREKIHLKFSILLEIFYGKIFNLQSKKRAFIIGEKHYDLGNELFQNMLDKRMNYGSSSNLGMF